MSGDKNWSKFDREFQIQINMDIIFFFHGKYIYRGNSSEVRTEALLTSTVPHAKNVSLGVWGQRRPRSACAFAQSDQGLHCLLTESLETKEYIWRAKPRKTEWVRIR